MTQARRLVIIWACDGGSIAQHAEGIYNAFTFTPGSKERSFAALSARLTSGLVVILFGATMLTKRFYFPHDISARNDQKVLMLRFKHGTEGYGIYMMLLEIMAEDSTGYLNSEAIQAYTLSIGSEYDRIADVIRTCLDVGLFKVCEHGNYYSERMLEYKSRRVNASEQAQAAIKKRWENQRLNTTVLPPNYDRNTGSNTKESRVEESRVEESRVEESRVEKKKEKRAQAPFIAPTFEEYEGYCKEHGFIGIARRSFDGYAAADWHDSQGSPVRNWRQKLCNVWFLDEHKDKPVEVRKPYKGGL